MIVLGIETSCDDTAAAIVTGERAVLSDLVLSQLEIHRPFGGVVPEIAARAHLDHLDSLIGRAVTAAGVEFHDLDAIAATAGPGLIGGLIVGVTMAKAIACVHDLPFIAVNHLEGHALSANLAEIVSFPYLLLLVSGGHCQLLIVEDVGRYRRLGGTLDDAIGEAFDKTAKLLGLSYPGGPAVERAAASGDAGRFALPRPMVGRPGCDFSFSGLKTAVVRAVETLPAGPLADQDVADLAAAFQAAAADVVDDRTANAIAAFKQSHPAGESLVVAGGVAANQVLRTRLKALADRNGLRFIAPPPRLCTDNAAMIAWVGIERLRRGLVDRMDFAARPRWPLESMGVP